MAVSFPWARKVTASPRTLTILGVRLASGYWEPSHQLRVERARPSSSSMTLVAPLLIPLYLVALVVAIQTASYDVWGGLLIAPILFAVTVGPITRAARRENDTRVANILIWALVLKFVGTGVRYFFAFEVYEGLADAAGYHGAGAKLAQSFRAFDFDVDLGMLGEGTRALRAITGVVYTFIGPTKLGGFFVFSWLGFLGLFFTYRAFKIAIPDGDGRRYALLMLFIPSLLFWPSSIGKESWMMFALGLVALGAANAFERRRGGFVLLAGGLWAASIVRPHIAVIAFISLFGGYLLRRGGNRHPRSGLAAKIIGVAFLLVAGSFVATQASEFFGVDSVDGQSVDDVLAKTEERSSKGGSAFKPVAARSPLDLPAATITVLFRPFPTEAKNAQALVAAAETMFLLGVCLVSWRRLLSVPRQSLRLPYVAFCSIYTLLFIFAFSSVGNFGILARQRVQVLPFLVVLVCIPLARPRLAARGRFRTQ